MGKNEYSFNSKTSKIDDKTGIELFTLLNFNSIIHKNKKIHLKGKYFGVKYGMQYGHLLMDGIGPYLYLKKQYPDLQLVFFKYGNTQNNLVCENFIDFFNAKVIDVFENNYLLDEFMFFYTEDLRITGIQNNRLDSNINIFIPPIPSNLFLNDYYHIDENNPKWLLYRKESIKILYETFSKYREKIKPINIYITRTTDKTRTDNYSQSGWFKEIREIDNIYENNLDIEINKLGYQVIDFNKMSFFEQINICYNSKKYVSIDGSSLLNSIWCDDDAEIFKISINKNYKKINYKWNEIISATNKYNIVEIDVTNDDPNTGLNKIVQTLS